MKYFAKELLNGIENIDDARNIDSKECQNENEVKKFVEDISKKGFDLLLKRDKKDYGKLIMVDLFFEAKNKNE